ncbi:MAG: DUF58 domain-containing protein [Leptolyngbyaceae cyanobacterium MO_188.B28]|nr:DUF58 domain-containing protein [Leptolyngbyaceae cyanobacterium MO_188.B28]
MPTPQRLVTWLETHWTAPSYSGWVVLGLTLFFFGAATNTLAGWLYVMSGVMAALLAVAAVLSPQMLKGALVNRQPIRPVSVGDSLHIELSIENSTSRAKGLLQVQDLLPRKLGETQQIPIAAIGPRSHYRWSYQLPTQQRGVHHWRMVQLRTAAPLGLFWSCRRQTAKAVAVVYPTILPLNQCPLIDELGQEEGLQWRRDRRAENASEGLTRGLRPYRWGDPTRLIHWRTSARHGELRVRELEKFTSGQGVILCLDSASRWQPEAFEQAVIATASLYCYAVKQGLLTQVWTAKTGLMREKHRILAALAAVESDEVEAHRPVPQDALIWLSQASPAAQLLPPGSRWVQWLPNFGSSSAIQTGPAVSTTSPYPRLLVSSASPLQTQLQSPVNS